MTLGDIFGCLGRIPLRSILKFWGNVTILFLVLFVVSMLMGAVIFVVWLFVTIVPWPIALLFVFVVGGLFAAHATKEDDWDGPITRAAKEDFSKH